MTRQGFSPVINPRVKFSTGEGRSLLDFRVAYTQSLEFFTAVQRQSVPSRMIVCPDEGHWILKPENSAFWYQDVLAWIKIYL